MKLIDVRKKLEKSFPDSIYSGQALVNLGVPRVPTGCMVLDIALGGGLPEGKFNNFWGAKSSGKTTMALRVAGTYLRKYPNRSVVWIDFEHAYDHDWAKNYISDFGRFHLVVPDYGEQGVDMLRELAMSEDVGLIIVDSLAMIVSAKESDGDASDAFVALQVKLINRMLRNLMPIVSRARKSGRPITVLTINQVRSKFGGKAFAGQSRQPGGKMLEHILTTDIRFYQVEVKKVGGVPTLSSHSFLLEKNRVGLPKAKGDYSNYLRAHKDRKAGELEESKTIEKMGRSAGIIVKQSGGTWTAGKHKFGSLTALTDAIASDPKLRDSLKKEITEVCIDNIELSGGEDSDDDSSVSGVSE